MAQRTAQLIVGQIFADEECRWEFLERPIKTVTSLRGSGFELANVAVDARARTNRWFWAEG